MGLQLLNETKDAFIGYAENSETIAGEFEIAEGEIKKVKKIFNLESANVDLKKRQDLFGKSNTTVTGLFDSINANMATMSIVTKIEELVAALTAFDNSLKVIDEWKDAATAELNDIKEASGAMLPEDRVARTMDLQEDIAAKLEIIK